jgi:hypothetical protein
VGVGADGAAGDAIAGTAAGDDEAHPVDRGDYAAT